MSSTGRVGTNPAPTLYVDRRHATLQPVNRAETLIFQGGAPSPTPARVDRRTTRNWIALVALGVLVTVLAACSGQSEDSSSSQSALAEKGRWSLPSDVLTGGAKVRVTYDDAPKWTGSAACGGELLPGGHKLGEYLLDHFDAVSSVGGYACRRNTADSSRMSVHGTGRALDVFIPKTNGAADNTRGDRVANWLVMHAQRIGVQLVIWDRTIWRANGTNDSAYGGPHPHDDHIHVEITTEAASLSTPWFSDMGEDPSTTDGGTDDASIDAARKTDAGTTSPPTDTDAGAGDAGTTTSPKDAAPVDPANDDHQHEEPDAATAPPGTSGTPPMTGNPSDGLQSAGDTPGETDSLPDVPKSKGRTTKTLDDPPMPNKGCSAAPRGAHVPAGEMGGSLALALGVAAWLRRRRSPRA